MIWARGCRLPPIEILDCAIDWLLLKFESYLDWQLQKNDIRLTATHFSTYFASTCVYSAEYNRVRERESKQALKNDFMWGKIKSSSYINKQTFTEYISVNIIRVFMEHTHTHTLTHRKRNIYSIRNIAGKLYKWYAHLRMAAKRCTHNACDGTWAANQHIKACLYAVLLFLKSCMEYVTCLSLRCINELWTHIFLCPQSKNQRSNSNNKIVNKS